jgi:hypothetical protein
MLTTNSKTALAFVNVNFLKMLRIYYENVYFSKEKAETLTF